MERTCEFCGVRRPVVYCQSDAAFLCLSCDAKVHSANALSGRHYRDLLCDSCRDNAAFVRCIDHSMLLCRGCESRLHDVFAGHKKLMLKSFTGCPSAQHFASLWGFNLSEQALFSVAGDRDDWRLKVSGPAKSERGRCSERYKEQNNHREKHNNSLVLQQILSLKKLQVAETEKQSFPTFIGSGNADAGSLNPTLKEDTSLNRNVRSFDDSSHALENEDFRLPVSQLDHLSNSSLDGDLGSSQFWSQNLQDLGVCEDLGHFDDLNIPDVDLSFRNFEELFANEVDGTHPLLKDSDLTWSEVAKAALLDVSENSHAKTTQDVSGSSSISFNNDISSKDKTHRLDDVVLGIFGNMEGVSRSFLSAESSGSDCLDSGHSESFTETEFGESSRKISQGRKKSQSHGKQS